jgi:flagellar assembly protein FliH
MTVATKFLFDTVFDTGEENEQPESADEIEPEEEAPTFSEEDVNQARSEGFAAGREEGIRESANATECRIMETVAMIAERLSELFRVQEEASAAAAQNAISVATAVTRKVFPDLARRNALGEVDLVLRDVMDKVADEPRVVMHVNDQLYEPLTQRIATLAGHHGFQGQVLLRADAEIPPGDCRLEWSNGGCDRDAAGLWREIDAIIARNLGTGPAGEDEPVAEEDPAGDAAPDDGGPEPTAADAVPEAAAEPASDDDIGQPPETTVTEAPSDDAGAEVPAPADVNETETVKEDAPARAEENGPGTPPPSGDNENEQPTAPHGGG